MAIPNPVSVSRRKNSRKYLEVYYLAVRRSYPDYLILEVEFSNKYSKTNKLNTRSPIAY